MSQKNQFTPNVRAMIAAMYDIFFYEEKTSDEQNAQMLQTHEGLTFLKGNNQGFLQSETNTGELFVRQKFG